MKKETLKKLGFCEAYESMFGLDEYNTKCQITEDYDEYFEWQEFTEENELKIQAYKNKFLTFFKETTI